jgi:FkbM family methyltransferase
MLYNINDVYVGRSFDLYGEFSEGEAEVFRQLVRPGDVVLEVGANVGAHTVALAQLVGPGGAVIAFEPQRIAFQMLCANVALNNLTNVHTFQAAAGAAPGQIAVPELDPNQPNNFGGLALGANVGTPGSIVPVIRIDDLPVPACRLIKIDVEGMELDVLKGCTQLIATFSPVLYVENDREDRSADLIRFIDSLGYAMYWHRPALFNPANFAGRADNVFGNVISVNMLCLPKSARSAIQGMPPVEVPA